MLIREKSSDLDLSCLLTILPGVSALLSEVGVGGVKTCHTHSSHENYAWRPQRQRQRDQFTNSTIINNFHPVAR